MRLKHVVSAVIAFLVGTASLQVGAIQFGQPDGEGHPYVGLVAFFSDELATVQVQRCTGTLISPTVFLTAGHCADTAYAVRARVWFEEVTPPRPIYPSSGGFLGTPVSHPDWNGGLTLPNTHDVGVVILDDPLEDRGFAQLPTEGFLNALATQRGLQDETFTVVGYGAQSIRPTLSTQRARFVATTKLVNLSSHLTDGFNIHLSNNPGRWSGGMCFGDSGGPVFFNNTNILVAVTSFGLSYNCTGSGFGYRVDQESARSFLEDYVELP